MDEKKKAPEKKRELSLDDLSAVRGGMEKGDSVKGGPTRRKDIDHVGLYDAPDFDHLTL